MDQLKELLGSADFRRKAIIGIATFAMFAAILAMAGLASRSDKTLLYSGLEASQAGEVVQALEARGVSYEIRGGAIFVEASERDGLRMTLASEGLPANGVKGYELLDQLNGFGTTAQMFDAAYWRAKEGELARTIAASPLVEKARVHIANSSRNPFQRRADPSASVAVTATDGNLPPSHAKALRFLVASAVAGLRPENVTVIDDNGGLIGTSDEQNTSDTAFDKADELRAKVAHLLEARVGYGNAVVEVSVDTVTETQSIRETVIDPESRVAISTDTEERAGNSTKANSDVTVASNLPEGDAANNGSSNASENSETRERINYEVSETLREITRVPGAIKRISVAVLVNGAETTAEGSATEFTPRSEAELADLRELVASAVGFDESRGDVITIKSLQLQTPDALGTEAISSAFAGNFLNTTTLSKMGILGLVALILGLFVLRPLLTKPASPPQLDMSPSLPSADDLELPLLDDADDGMPDFGSMPMAAPAAMPGGMPGMDAGGYTALPEQDHAERIRGLIAERQDETVEILRNWLEQKG